MQTLSILNTQGQGNSALKFQGLNEDDAHARSVEPRIFCTMKVCIRKISKAILAQLACYTTLAGISGGV